jgi:hypothetical protein
MWCIQKAMTEAWLTTAKRKEAQETKIHAALENNYDQTSEALATPNTLDQVNKARQVAVRKATLATKRKRLVATAQADNGAGALMAELQNTSDEQAEQIATGPPSPSNTSTDGQETTGCQTVQTVTDDPGDKTLTTGLQQHGNQRTDPITKTTKKTITTNEKGQTGKATDKTNESVGTTPSTLQMVIVQPEIKCEGCVHCDLLELKIMEPARIKHYLHKYEFLEFAECNGINCTKSIRDVHTASPKDNIHYCDVGKKGWDAPEDDPKKASMECRLVLCQACYRSRGERYELANSGGGRTNGRSSRRRRK